MHRARFLRFFWVVAVFCLVAGCGEGNGEPGSDCEYSNLAGEAVVTTVVGAPVDQYNCDNSPTLVVFTFEPDNQDPPTTGAKLLVSDGRNPPRAWVTAEGLTEGSRHPCVQGKLTKGSCTPVVYEFTGVDYTAAAAACLN
jgi:hypothetical protein